MATPIILQSIFTDYIFPFLLVFFVAFAVLERTKLFGDDKRQINALTAFVIGLIFVVSGAGKLIVQNMVVFLAVALVCLLVILLLWGFVWGDKEGFKPTNWMKWGLGILIGIGFLIALVFATGFNVTISNFFVQAVNQNIITNVVFIVIIAIALVLVLVSSRAKKS